MTLNCDVRRLDFSDAQLKLIRRSVARSCTTAEFDEFMAVAAQCGLDPLRRQITPLIVAADDPNRRRLIPWTTIDGLRVIAARNNDYRPMEDAPVIEYDRTRIDEAKNPLGIVRAEVRAWKASGGVWHAVVGEAWWDEFAPMSRSDASRLADDGAARSAPVGADANSPPAEWRLDPAWKRAGRVMIAKCAEAQALRRGWPDLLSGLYGEEELKAARLAEHTASELLQSVRDEEARKRKATRTLWFVSKAGASFESVSACDVEKFVSAIYLGAEAGADIKRFDEDNRASLATYWDWMPREAFRLKRMSETLQAAFNSKGDEALPERPAKGGTQNILHDAREASRAPNMSDHKDSSREKHCRRRPSSELKRRILESQKGSCLACGLKLADVEFDHIVPLGLGGGNAPDNWAAVCSPCHKNKTRADLKRIAKSKRQRRYHETGRSRAKSMYSPIVGGRVRGFGKDTRRHINGLVTHNCLCSRCRRVDGK